MDSDSKRMRDTRPFIFSNLKKGEGVPDIVDFIVAAGGLSSGRH
jgi:urease accessory protein